MLFPRAAGILLHPTSLPSPGGIGDMGPDAFRFVRWLADAGMKIWQVLPLGPTGYGDSPYQCFSAFAGNPLLIHVPEQARTQFGHDVAPASAHVCDFGTVIPAKRALLDAWLATIAYDDAVRRFVREQESWLPDYALFMALKEAHGGASWTAWERGAADREPEALRTWREKLRPAIVRCYKEQYVFAGQLRALRTACAAQNIQLMGDVPIFVAHDSADVWANRSLFKLNSDGTLIAQAGVPPDYFSETGQLWGNPLYDWDAMARDGYRWWIERMRAALAALPFAAAYRFALVYRVRAGYPKLHRPDSTPDVVGLAYEDVRVPTSDVSVIDLTVELSKDATYEAICAAMKR